MNLRGSVGHVQNDAEVISSIQKQLQEHFTGKCRGEKNELDSTLQEMGLSVSGNKSEKCGSLAVHLHVSQIPLGRIVGDCE